MMQIEEFHPQESKYELSELDNKQVAVFVEQKQPTPAMMEIFHRVLAQKNVVSNIEDQIKTHQTELAAINKDQARIRENMKALKGSAEEKTLLQRYTKQLDSQEDSLNTLNKDIAALQQKQAQEQQKLDEMVQQITLDENF